MSLSLGVGEGIPRNTSRNDNNGLIWIVVHYTYLVMWYRWHVFGVDLPGPGLRWPKSGLADRVGLCECGTLVEMFPYDE